MKLGLGTVQFGLDYGISNAGGRTPVHEVVEILKTARDHGVAVVDTATAYGCSEQVLGQAGIADGPFRVVTKTVPIRKERIDANDAATMRTRFLDSLTQMKLRQVHGLLVHHCEDLLAPGGTVLWEELCRLKAEGYIGLVGASVYSGAQIDRLMAQYDLEIIQLPLNVFDQRLIASNHLRSLKAAGVEIHVRSAFLQGLLLMDPAELPVYFHPIMEHLESYRAYVNQSGLSLKAAAYHFVASRPEVDTVVCGVNDNRQFEELCRIAGQPSALDLAGYALADERYIDPSKWPS